MQVIINFFAGIADSITSLIDLLFSFLRDFLQFLQLLGRMPAILLNMLSWFPSDLMLLVGFLFSVVILYKVLGREG